jgi:HK97 family phage prohead protease
MTLGQALKIMDEEHRFFNPHAAHAPIALCPASLSSKGLSYRGVSLNSLNLENRTVSFSCSSETPVCKGDCYEILSHAPGALRTERLDRGVVPLLSNHSIDHLLGRITGYQIANRKLYVSARVSRSDTGDQLLRDLADQIATQASIGYLRHSLRPTGERDGLMEFTVDTWEVTEVSFVACPADSDVGYGRSF